MADLNLVEDLYHRLGPVLDALALNHEGIAYHANGVIKSEVFQLARRDDEDRYLHLIAFIAHQYYRLQDNLVDVLITSLQSYQNSALREHKDQCYARREQRNPSLAALLGYLDETLLRTLTTIRAITDDNQLNDAEKVEGIRTLLEPGREAPEFALKISLVLSRLSVGTAEQHRQADTVPKAKRTLLSVSCTGPIRFY